MRSHSPSFVRRRIAIATSVAAGLFAVGNAIAQPTVAIALPLDHPAFTAHYSSRSKHAFAPRAYVIVSHKPVRFLGVSPDEIDESYDDTDDEFDAADTDNDGFISFREARRTNADWAKNFNKIDTSGDGFLTREEIDAFYRR